MAMAYSTFHPMCASPKYMTFAQKHSAHIISIRMLMMFAFSMAVEIVFGAFPSSNPPPVGPLRAPWRLFAHTPPALPAHKIHLTRQTANFPKPVTARTIAIRRCIITPHYLELAEKVWMLLNEKWKKKRFWDEQADLKIWISIATE